MRLLFALLLVLAGTTLPAQQTARVVTTVTKGAPAWKTWKNDACATNYPGTWSVDNSGITGTAVTFLAPRDSSGASPARVELLVKDLQGSLGDLLKSSANDLHLDGVDVIADEPFEDQHLRELDAKQDGRPVHVRQSAWSHGGKAYLLTFVAEAASYEETRILADAMINSFRFL